MRRGHDLAGVAIGAGPGGLIGQANEAPMPGPKFVGLNALHSAGA